MPNKQEWTVSCKCANTGALPWSPRRASVPIAAVDRAHPLPVASRAPELLQDGRVGKLRPGCANCKAMVAAFTEFPKPEPTTDLEGALRSSPVLPQCTKTCPVACPLVTPPMACSVWAPLIFPLSEGVGNHGTYFTFLTIHSRGDRDLEADLTCQQVLFGSEVGTQEPASRVLIVG